MTEHRRPLTDKRSYVSMARTGHRGGGARGSDMDGSPELAGYGRPPSLGLPAQAGLSALS